MRCKKYGSAGVSHGEKETEGIGLLLTRKYFDLVCFVESTFLANLTLKMMMAYNDGDIISKIKFGIFLHNDSRARFFCLSGSNNVDNNHHLLAYIMERYANMQGIYFAKHLKGNNGDQLKKLASCQATRTKVAHAVVYAKTGGIGWRWYVHLR